MESTGTLVGMLGLVQEELLEKDVSREQMIAINFEDL